MSTAVIGLIIFGICVVLFVWNKLPIAWTAMMGLLAMVLFNVVSFSDGFKNFAGSTIILICAMMVVGQAAFETGLAQVVGNKVIDMAHGNERVVIILGTLITGLTSAFLSNIATLAIMISILTSVCASNDKVRFKNVIMPVGMAAVIGGAATLVGSTTQLTGNGIVETYLGEGNAFDFFTFSIPGFIILAVLVIYAGFIGYPLGKKIWSERDDYIDKPVEDDIKIDLKNIDKTKMIIMAIIFVLTVIAFILVDVIKKVIPNFNIAIVSLLSACACIVTGCISQKKAMSSINWSLAIWFCSSLGIAEGLNKSGGGQMLANVFLNLFGSDVSPFMLFVAFVLFVILLTQFLSNSTVLTIALPIAIPMLTELGYNPYPYAVGMTLAAAMAVATPLANTTIGMSMVANYKFGDYLKYAGPVTFISFLLILLIVPLMWPLV